METTHTVETEPLNWITARTIFMTSLTAKMTFTTTATNEIGAHPHHHNFATP